MANIGMNPGRERMAFLHAAVYSTQHALNVLLPRSDFFVGGRPHPDYDTIAV